MGTRKADNDLGVIVLIDAKDTDRTCCPGLRVIVGRWLGRGEDEVRVHVLPNGHRIVHRT